MATDTGLNYLEWMLVFSFAACPVLMIACVTVVFPKVVQVEAIVATPGKHLDTVKRLWGSGLIGRWMRCGHVFCFILMARVPVIGAIWRRNAGDETDPVPMALKLWIDLPMGFLFFSATLAVVATYSLGAY